MEICFVLVVNFGLFATVIQLSLSTQTLQQNNGYIVNSPNKSAVSFIRLINKINDLIEFDITMFLLYLVLRVISV